MARRRPLLEVVMVLALVWGALAGYSFFGGAPWVVAGVTLEKSAIRAEVAGEPLRAEASLPPRWSFALPPEGVDGVVAALAPPRDETPQRILLFGDSMIDELMLRLADYCLENGHELHPAVWYGAGTLHWAQDDKLQQLLRAFRPTYAIVVLGANELTSRNAKEQEIAVRRIVATLGDLPFLWIGPPNWQKDTGINALIERSTGTARFFHSADLELQRKRDGIHPTREASASWMDAIARFLEERSAHRIRMAVPQKAAPRPVAQVFPPPGHG